MSEEKQNQESINLLNALDTIDLTKVDRSYPLLEEGTYSLRLAKFEAKPNSRKTGHNLQVTLETTTDVSLVTIGSDGTKNVKKTKPGWKVNDSFSLVQTDKYNPMERLADIQLACFGEQRKGFKSSEMVGLIITARVTIKDDPEFGRKNLFRYVKKAAGSTGIASL